MAISMVLSGIQAVAMPLITEFQFTPRSTDRLLAPIEIGWLAVEKIVAGMIQALVAGLVVMSRRITADRLGVNLSFHQPWHSWPCACWWRFSRRAGGLSGVQRGPNTDRPHVQPVLAPMIMFGCAYYPWSALKAFPVLQIAVLANPLSIQRGLRGALAPQAPHMNMAIVWARCCSSMSRCWAAG